MFLLASWNTSVYLPVCPSLTSSLAQHWEGPSNATLLYPMLSVSAMTKLLYFAVDDGCSTLRKITFLFAGESEIWSSCSKAISRNKLCKEPLLRTTAYVKTQRKSRTIRAGLLKPLPTARVNRKYPSGADDTLQLQKVLHGKEKYSFSI